MQSRIAERFVALTGILILCSRRRCGVWSFRRFQLAVMAQLGDVRYGHRAEDRGDRGRT